MKQTCRQCATMGQHTARQARTGHDDQWVMLTPRLLDFKLVAPDRKQTNMHVRVVNNPNPARRLGTGATTVPYSSCHSSWSQVMSFRGPRTSQLLLKGATVHSCSKGVPFTSLLLHRKHLANSNRGWGTAQQQQTSTHSLSEGAACLLNMQLIPATTHL